MINDKLHLKPVALDRIQHRALRLDTEARDLSTVRRLNAFFVAVTEFADAAKDFPLVWVNAGTSDQGVPLVAPIAVFGLKEGQNLCVQDDAWRTRYVPQALRLYPFAMARLPPDQLVVVFDAAWAGFQPQRGQALFADDGQPSAFTLEVKTQLEAFEQDIERTRLVGEQLVQLGLLREMRFDATLPNGETLAVDGFLTINDQRLAELPEADVLALHRNGVLGLIHAHQISLGNMPRLAEWYAQRVAPPPAPQASA